jgi:putative intracellular protease/amidase
MRNILMVVSSCGTMDGGQPTGAWLEELAASYFVFADAGCEITIASPHGGKAPLDPLSLEEPWLTSSGKRFNADLVATGKLERSVALAEAASRHFDAVYCVGGAATAWDFPGDGHLAAIVGRLHAGHQPVAGVCHGVLGLTGAHTPSGKPIVAGRAVTGISNAEEVLTGFDKLVPVLPETRLGELGGRYSCAAPLAEHVVVDGNVLTGQNPASAEPLARAVLAQLG